MEDGIKPIGGTAFTGEPARPKSVGSEQMIGRAVEPVKGITRRTLSLFVGQGESGCVGPRIGSSGIRGELPANRFRPIGFSFDCSGFASDLA